MRVLHLLLEGSPTMDKSTWAAFAIATAAAMYLMVQSRRKKKSDPLEKPFNVSLSQQRAVEQQMQSLLVELSEMSRQITAQLDTRAAKLELLIKEADEKI